jgi:hypothetical protein
MPETFDAVGPPLGKLPNSSSLPIHVRFRNAPPVVQASGTNRRQGVGSTVFDSRGKLSPCQSGVACEGRGSMAITAMPLAPCTCAIAVRDDGSHAGLADPEVRRASNRAAIRARPLSVRVDCDLATDLLQHRDLILYWLQFVGNVADLGMRSYGACGGGLASSSLDESDGGSPCPKLMI